MRADRLARLCRIASGGAPTSFADGVTVAPGVTPKKPGVTPVTPLRLKNDGKGKGAAEVGGADATLNADDADAIEERAGLAADRVPAVYLDAWARLNCQKPASVSEADWWLALDDGGRFLDAWGADAATMRWTAGELFDVPREGRPGGLVWRLKGERVTALAEHRARLRER